uniref:Uncharacterized protein n=1 Tax=Arundo donax TaxID=35708 RepID=A0A0A9ABX8_ARUDO
MDKMTNFTFSLLSPTFEAFVSEEIPTYHRC